MNLDFQLSLEQEFKVRAFADQLQSLSHEELQELMVSLYQNSLVQENLFQKILGEYMGLSAAAAEKY